MTQASSSSVSRNDALDRYELESDGHVALLAFRRDGDRLVLVHTEVPRPMEGGGVGGQLVRAAVDEAAAEGLTVVPSCSFARGWLERHPDVAERITIDWPGRR